MPNKKAQPLSNYHRVFLLSILKDNPMNVSELAKRLRISRRAVYHHLNQLLKNGLVKPLQAEQHSRGKPVKWELTKRAKPIEKPILQLANKIFNLKIELNHKLKKK